MNILDNMLESNQYVIKNAKDVKINYERLNTFIENIDCSNLKNWLGNNPYNLFNLGIEKIVNFLLLFEAIDYCFWGEPKWKIETVEGIKDGSDALLYVLLNYVRKNDCFVFDKISLNDFKKILNGNVEIPFIEERYNTLIQISEIVNKKINN